MPSLNTVTLDILALGVDIHVDTTTPDLFFFRGEERHMPFATIVTRDTAFDSFSRLDADDAFRLNVELDRTAFAEIFPGLDSRSALENADLDYKVRDRLMPHPIYGRMHWVCVIAPDAVYSECMALLKKAYARHGQ